ncbi:hypothetical protein ES703_83926 [subsurface metagenome]
MANHRKLELHADATKNFNEKADNLLIELTPYSQQSLHKRTNIYQPDSFVSAHIAEKDIIGEIKLSKADYAGREIAKFFKHGDKYICLNEKSYKKLTELAKGMQNTKALRDMVSVVLVTDYIFDWMKNKYINRTSMTMADYVINKCEKELKELEIWIPIAMTYIQSEIKIGKIILQTITKDMIKKWSAEWQTTKPEDQVKIQQLFEKERKNLQGLAAATIKLFAEPARAFEISLAEAEKAISLLRFFSPANIFPEIVSYCTVLGKENVETIEYLATQNGKLLRIHHAILDKSALPWHLDNNILSTIKENGLDILSDLLNQDNLTEFQKVLLNSLMLYSKSSLAKDFVDKLVYIIVALESILLRNENEPIQQNIGERMAFLIGKSISERESIIKNFKKAYRLRSSFFHHGHSIEEIDTLKELMRNAWLSFSELIQAANQFNTKEELIGAIERRKLL